MPTSHLPFPGLVHRVEHLKGSVTNRHPAVDTGLAAWDVDVGDGRRPNVSPVDSADAGKQLRMDRAAGAGD